MELLPLWRRDNQRRVERIVVYDPRSLAQVWIVDETTGDYIAVPYRVPHPDMTLAQSEEARRRLQALKAQDRTERRLFENLAEIRAIEAGARSATCRRKAERSRQAAKSARAAAGQATAAGGRPGTGSPAVGTGDDCVAASPRARTAATTAPTWAGQVIAPFTDVEVL